MMWVFLKAFVITALITAFLIRRGGLSLDIPNDRSSHTNTTPRGGGLAFILGTVIAYVLGGGALPNFTDTLLSKPSLTLICIGALGFGLVGMIEDLRNLSVTMRLFVEVLMAAALAGSGLRWTSLDFGFGRTELSFFVSFAISIGWYVWIANLYNFMDGINGIATTVGCTLAVFFYFIAQAAGLPGLETLMLALAGALVGFLPFNFPKSRIFMGDSGSLFLGFLFAALPLYVHRETSQFSMFYAVLAMAPFFFDATITLFRRLLSGQNVTVAHRGFFFHRTTELFKSHSPTTLLYCSASIAFCGLVFRYFSGAESRRSLALFAVAFLFGFFTLVQWLWTLRSKRAGI